MGKRQSPYPLTDANAQIYHRNLFDKVLTTVESRRVRAKMRKRSAGAKTDLQLAHPTAFRPLCENDIAAVFLAHNDAKFMRSLLAHYRTLGVSRFICVDDQSTDGTRQFLTAEPDVDLWVSGMRYKDARRGRLWRESLFSIYGKNRWYLNIDSDEYLVYQDCFRKPLPHLIRHLEALGVSRLSAPMIDMYPPGPPGDFPFAGADETMPWAVASCFDSNGYTLALTKRFLELQGGPRQRRFGSQAELMKYPLLYWDDACGLGTTIHKPIPYDRNFFPISAALLHFKFFADYREKTKEAIEDKQYFNEASEYVKILKTVSDGGDVDFLYGGTLSYSSPEHLVESGLISPIWLCCPSGTP